MKRRRWCLPFALALLHSACAFYPKKSEEFVRPTCEVYQNPLTLDMFVVDRIDCGGGDVRGCLIAYSAVGPVTAAASGSVVLAGNGLYWLGNRSHCSIRAYARHHWR